MGRGSRGDSPVGGKRGAGARVRERRRAHRYPLTAGLHFRVCERGAPKSGDGESCDISSKAIRFISDTQPTVGSIVEIALRWPLRLGEALPLRLVLFGPVLRRDSRGVVALIKRYSFVREAEAETAESEGQGESGFPRTKTAG